jgi:hypothetical protein
MNLYDLHDNPKGLHRHDDADAQILEVFWKNTKIIQKNSRNENLLGLALL